MTNIRSETKVENQASLLENKKIEFTKIERARLKKFMNDIIDCDNDYDFEFPEFIVELFNKHKISIVRTSIDAAVTYGDNKETPSELAQLNGAVSPIRAFTGSMQAKPMSKGKRSVLADMLVDSINSLPTARGRDIYFLAKNSTLTRTPQPGTILVLPKSELLATLLKDGESQYQLLGSVLNQCLPRPRGWPDLVNPLFYVNWLTARVSMIAERVLFTVGSWCSTPFHEARKKYAKAEGAAAWGWGAAVAVASIPHVIGQVPTLVGNVLRYTRHLVDGIANFVSSGIAILARSDKDQYRDKNYPTLKVCAKAIGKSLLFLIPAVAILACCFIPGMQVVPALAATVANLPIASAIASWAGIGVGTALTSQTVTMGLRKAVIAGRSTPSTTAQLSSRGVASNASRTATPPVSTTVASVSKSGNGTGFIQRHENALASRAPAKVAAPAPGKTAAPAPTGTSPKP